MSLEKEVKTAAVGGATRAIVQHIVLTYVIPIAVPIITLTLGYVNSVPWFWIWLGCLASFAFVTTGLVQLDVWLTRRQVEGRLKFEGVMVARSADGDNGVVIGLRVLNTANFPVDWEIAELHSQVDDRVPASKIYRGATKFTIAEGNSAWFWDNPIVLQQPTTPGTHGGTFKFKVRYGRVGNVKYELSGTKSLLLNLDPQGNLLNASWHEMA